MRGRFPFIKTGLFVAVAMLMPGKVFSQADVEKWGISAAAMGGYVWAHKGPVDNLKAHVYGGTVGFRVQTAGHRQWQRIFNRPAWGVDALYLYYGNPNILGSAYALLPYVEFPIFRAGKVKFNLKAAAGMGYITQPFNVNSNVANGAIGSHLNGGMAMHGTINIPLGANSELYLMGGLTHFSNGNFKMPNLGVNTPDIKIGYTHYVLHRKTGNTKPNSMDTTLNSYNLSIAFARKYTDYIFPYRVLVGIAQFKYLRSLSVKSKLGGGLDVFYDEGNYYSENRTGTALQGNPADAVELAAKASYLLQIGRLGLVTDIGVYLYNKNKVKGPIYQRIGLQYGINGKMAVYTALKVHFARADYFEWGISYKLNKN